MGALGLLSYPGNHASRVGFRHLTCLALAMMLPAVASAQYRALPQNRAMRLRPPVVGAAGKRVALVIGNNLYPQSPLKNAVGDALLMKNVLEEIGFAVEPPLLNATALDIERAVRTFAGKLEGADVGFFFYAGHGIAVEGQNYLLGVDFAAEDELEARHKAVEADLIEDRMNHGGARLNLIVMDACRNNPYKLGKRAAGSGISAMEAGRGMLIALATAPGKAASDNPDGANGLFTQYLAENLKEPGLGVKEVFDRVKAQVIEASGGLQRPWVHDDVVGDVTLVPAEAPPPVAVADNSPLELAFWNSIKDSRNPRDFQGYLDEVAKGTFGGTFKSLAENRIADSRSVAEYVPPASTPPSLPPPSPATGPPETLVSVTPDARSAPPLPVGYLDLTGAANTQIFIDGKEIGRLPFAPEPLEDALFLTEGNHEIKLIYPGYQPLVHTVNIRAGETTALFVDLGLDERDEKRPPVETPASTATPAKASTEVPVTGNAGSTTSTSGNRSASATVGFLDLAVSPDPTQIQLVVDSKEARSLTGKPLQLSPGTHTITLFHPAFRPLVRSFTIRPGETISLSVNLQEDGVAR